MGIGDWAQSPIPNPQSPIPNPQLKIFYFFILTYFYKAKINFYLLKKFIIIFKYVVTKNEEI